MITVLIAGFLCGAGFFAAACSFRSAPLGGSVALALPTPTGSVNDRLEAGACRVTAVLGLDPARRLAADLAVTGRSAESYALRSLVAAVWVAALVTVGIVALGSTGVRVSPVMTAVAAATGLSFGFAAAEVALRSHAAERRDEFRQDLGAFCELMVLLLAAGAGVESALAAAADAGDDWTWRKLREALRSAQLTRRSPAEALGDLGREVRLVELEELGAAVALAASSGGQLRSSLAARAEALRSRELVRQQAEAARATERMTFPVVALAVGFLIVLGFPALSKVLAGF